MTAKIEAFVAGEKNSAVMRGHTKSWLHRTFEQYETQRDSPQYAECIKFRQSAPHCHHDAH
jgi:hypothetical protein